MRPRSRIPAQLLAAAALLATLLPCASAPARATPEYTKNENKTKNNKRFTRFVAWPESVFASADSAFVICVWGSGPLATQLERVVARGKVKDRPARLFRVGA